MKEDYIYLLNLIRQLKPELVYEFPELKSIAHQCWLKIKEEENGR